MKLGIISDIHSNLEALNEVMSNLIDEQKVDEIICIGDIVGYGANPNECIKIVKENVKYCVAGNHDYGVIKKTSIKNFNKFAKSAIQWTRRKLSVNNYEYLQKLPLTKKIPAWNLISVHSSPSTPSAWKYLLFIESVKNEFNYFNEKICFIGHTHQPIVFEKCINEVNFYTAKNGLELKINGENKYIVNVGSVGQPRDGNPKSSFCTFNTKNNRLKILRVDYNIKNTQEKIIAGGLPKFLADRLEIGK
ncbi:MAG: metallophosphoesterase family protein [Candidatus Marinimicrobia bacterium]|nr:metallophosphoesterase family protein [Candidatus Neomarinimicrobiota bacterium]